MCRKVGIYTGPNGIDICRENTRALSNELLEYEVGRQNENETSYGAESECEKQQQRRQRKRIEFGGG